ncbi:MAG: hypothetical protein WAO71_09210 [Gallionella sp.]
MPQFIAFSKTAEVSGLAIMVCLESFPEYYRADIEHLLNENNIVQLAPEKWFNLQSYLNVLRDISTRYGTYTLFNVGVAINDKIPFPPNTTLESALTAMNASYSAHHRDDYTSYIKLRSFDLQAKKAVMEYKNPYPCHFERGLLTACARKFTPPNAGFIDVQLEKNKPSRLDGADTSFYEIIWL